MIRRLVATLFVLALASDPAWSAMWGAHSTGHGGGFGDSRMGHGGIAAGRGSATLPSGFHRLGHHRFDHKRHDHRDHGRDHFPYVAYGWEPYYAYEPAYEPDDRPEPPAPRRKQHSGYCDVSAAGPYPQDCVWKDGP